MTANQVAYQNTLQNERLKTREMDLQERKIENDRILGGVNAAGNVLKGVGSFIKGLFSPF